MVASATVTVISEETDMDDLLLLRLRLEADSEEGGRGRLHPICGMIGTGTGTEEGGRGPLLLICLVVVVVVAEMSRDAMADTEIVLDRLRGMNVNANVTKMEVGADCLGNRITDTPAGARQ